MTIHTDHIAAARRYAIADKSDPFTLARAMSHLRSGIASFNNDGEPAFYRADPVAETRKLPDGRTYTATAYRNLARP